jgi:hypothetical protein
LLLGVLLVLYCWATRVCPRSSGVVLGVRGPVRSLTSASDMAIVEFIKVWQSSSYKLAFGIELGPNLNCKSNRGEREKKREVFYCCCCVCVVGGRQAIFEQGLAIGKGGSKPLVESLVLSFSFCLSVYLWYITG